MPSFAAIATPPSDLTKKGLQESVRWEDAQEKTFVTLCESLVHRPILHLLDHYLTFILHTDALKCELGAALMQIFSNCIWKQVTDICRAEVFHHREGVLGHCVGSIEISSVSGR